VVQTKLKIGAIFGGKRGNGERSPGQIDALVFAEQSPIHDLTFDLIVTHPQDTQLNPTI